MTILALDSSGLVASVAILTDDSITAEYTINFKKTHSQTLLPMLDTIVSMVELDLSKIDAIAIASGPGSFTGLRIGSSTAKGLGLALKKPLISIPTIEGLAFNLFGTDKIICPIMDAKRNQVYTGLYEFKKDEFITLSEQKAVSIEEIVNELNLLSREVIFLGDGVEVYKDIIQEKITVPFLFAPAHLTKQRASAIATLGKMYYENGVIEEAAEHKPTYLRLPQAERERNERLNLNTKE